MMKHVNLSYWDQKHISKTVDVLIVGAGITGLSCAMRINQLRPELSIRVVDTHHITRVASTRNAGFVCFGSLTEILDDISLYGRSIALDLVDRRYQGIQLIRNTFSKASIDYYHTGGYELLPNTHWTKDQILASIADLSTELNAIVGSEVFTLVDRAAHAWPFDQQAHMVNNPHEGQLNPASYVQELAKMLPRNKVELFTGVEVKGIEFNDEKHVIDTSWGSMRAHQVVLATNGMTENLGIKHSKIKPARNLVLVSKDNLVDFKGVFHAEKGYIYFRNIGRRLLIGGGRHWDQQAEFVNELGSNSLILEKLKRYANEIILPNMEVDFEYQWSGIMGITENKTPIIEKLTDSVFLAAGFGGMGVALGMHSGFRVGELVCKENFY